MKVKIIENSLLTEDQVTIECKEITEEVTSLTTNLMSSVVAIGEFEVDGTAIGEPSMSVYPRDYGRNVNAVDHKTNYDY